MTDHSKPINPLMTRGIGPGNFSGKPEAYIRVNETMIPCSWDEFVAWMNENNKRDGHYSTKYLRDKNGTITGRQLDWIEHVGTDGYRREQASGKRAERAAPIQRYVTDYGRVSE